MNTDTIARLKRARVNPYLGRFVFEYARDDGHAEWFDHELVRRPDGGYMRLSGAPAPNRMVPLGAVAITPYPETWPSIWRNQRDGRVESFVLDRAATAAAKRPPATDWSVINCLAAIWLIFTVFAALLSVTVQVLLKMVR